MVPNVPESETAHSGLAATRGILVSGRSVGDEPLTTSQYIRFACADVAVLTLERVLAQGEPPADELNAAGYGFYTAGILEGLAQTPYEEMIAGDVVWVGTPEDVIERIEAVIGVCEGLTEISITVNAGGADHWQAIKNQELFAQRVMPHFKAAVKKKAAAAI